MNKMLPAFTIKVFHGPVIIQKILHDYDPSFNYFKTKLYFFNYNRIMGRISSTLDYKQHAYT